MKMTIDARIITAAQKSHSKFYPQGPFASVSIAQCGLESGWLKYMSGKNNCFGIKATQAQIAAGKATNRPTREENAAGKSYSVNAYFADYDSLDDCFEAHAALLCTSHYLACQKAATPEAYCDALQLDGYATAHNYASALKNIIASMNLKQYDVASVFSPIAQTKPLTVTPNVGTFQVPIEQPKLTWLERFINWFS